MLFRIRGAKFVKRGLNCIFLNIVSYETWHSEDWQGVDIAIKMP